MSIPIDYSSIIDIYRTYLATNGSDTFWKEIILCWKLLLARYQRLFNQTQITAKAISFTYLTCFIDSEQLLMIYQQKAPMTNPQQQLTHTPVTHPLCNGAVVMVDGAFKHDMEAVEGAILFQYTHYLLVELQYWCLSI